ncbi:MAG TPA: VWA domain-containing protein [Planctomycetaceae bacterium]|nr:VWA domain-containing protein [Planctomycetaceae bacterium]
MESATGIDWNRGSQFVRARRRPAWLVSLAVHVCLLVLLGLVLRPAIPKGLPSGDRPGGIVLAQTDQKEVRYVEPEGVPDAATSAPATSPDVADLPAEAMAGIDLPSPLDAPSAPSGVQIGQADASGVGRPTLGEHSRATGSGPKASLRPTPRFSGPTAKLSVFGSGYAEGNSFVFVIDRSKSMGSDGLGVLSQAKTELMQALETLDERHKFQVVAYHHDRVYLDRAGLLPATPDNRQRVAGFFDGLAAFGGTDHELALFAALGMKPDVIFLLTDGGSPGLTPGQLADIVRTANRMQTTIHCIQFGFGPAPEKSFMLDLARKTGGSYRYVQQ